MTKLCQKTSQNVPHLGSLEGRLELDIIELLLAELVNKMKDSACHKNMDGVNFRSQKRKSYSVFMEQLVMFQDIFDLLIYHNKTDQLLSFAN